MSRFTISDLETLQRSGKIRGYKVTGEGKEKKKSKYGNQKVEFDGYVFDSKKEHRRYIVLRARQTAGEIAELEVHVKYELKVEGEKIADYECDFGYKENGELIVEDVKSAITRKIAKYRLKKKLMKAIYNIEIREV